MDVVRKTETDVSNRIVVAVDKFGTEIMVLYRFNLCQQDRLGHGDKLIYSGKYSVPEEIEESRGDYKHNYRILPKGTIEKLTGLKLTFNDRPYDILSNEFVYIQKREKIKKVVLVGLTDEERTELNFEL